MIQARRMLLGLAVCASLLLVPTAALAEVRTGSTTDPTGDAPVPQRDITAAGISYDTQGSAVFKVTLAAKPTAAIQADLALYAGKAAGDTCRGDLLVGIVAPSGAEPFAEMGTPPRDLAPPTLTTSGSTFVVTEADARTASQAWDCWFVRTFDLDPNSQPADSTDAVDMKGPPAPSPPPPPPPPPAPTPTPTPAPAPVAKPPAAKPKPKTSAKLRKAIRSCQRRYKGSKRAAKRKRCISKARKKYGPKA